MRRLALGVLAILALAACGGAAGLDAPNASATSRVTGASPAAGAAASASAPADAVAITASNRTLVTVRVREQLGRLPAPSDAVLRTSAVSGQLLLRADGTFADGSRISVDLATLASDESQRDNFVKRTTLESSRYPTATFVPTKVTGLPSALPSSGGWKATLVGDLTIHGVTKEISWDATIKRSGGDVTGTATTNFKFGDFGMQVPAAPVVLSVVDDIRMQIDFVGTMASS